MAELLDRLLPLLESLTPAGSASIACELLSTDMTLLVDGSDFVYDVAHLLGRGGVAAAAGHVFQHQRSLRTGRA